MSSHPKKKRDKDDKFLKEIRKLPCIACGHPPPSTCSHIKTRGSGGGDDAFNVLPKCSICHAHWERDKLGFLTQFPHVQDHLLKLGWELTGTKFYHPFQKKH
jgi:hypothetical protein